MWPYIEAILRITPRVAFRSGKAALVIRKTEFRLMLMSYSQSSSVMDSQEFFLPDHALFTRMSMAWKCSCTCVKNSVAEFFFNRSSSRATALIEPPANCDHLLTFFLAFCPVAAGDNQVGAQFGECLADGGAQIASAAGNDRSSPFQGSNSCKVLFMGWIFPITPQRW